MADGNPSGRHPAPASRLLPRRIHLPLQPPALPGPRTALPSPRPAGRRQRAGTVPSDHCRQRSSPSPVGYLSEGDTHFEDFQDEAGEGEDVTRRVVAAVGVAVLAENDVLVAMHDLDAPMIAIDGQQSLWRGGSQAGDEMNDLVLRRLPL